MNAISAFILCLHILAITVFAVSPHAHEAIHHDAESSEHSCIIVLFEKGSVDSIILAFSVVAPVLAIITRLLITQTTFSWATPRHWLHIERAPPGLST